MKNFYYFGKIASVLLIAFISFNGFAHVNRTEYSDYYGVDVEYNAGPLNSYIKASADEAIRTIWVTKVVSGNLISNYSPISSGGKSKICMSSFIATEFEHVDAIGQENSNLVQSTISYLRTGSPNQISGMVYIDLNKNGIKETNEPIVQGALIRFYKYYDYKLNEEVLCEAITDAAGSYTVSPGYFPVRIQCADNEFDHLYGDTDLVLTEGGTIDFGIQLPLGN